MDSLYCRYKGKPQAAVLLSGLWVNILTQAGLWGTLMLFPRSYFAVLASAEILIWLLEGLWLAAFPRNRLTIREALQLSFFRNLASLGVGLLLPV